MQPPIKEEEEEEESSETSAAAADLIAVMEGEGGLHLHSSARQAGKIERMGFLLGLSK